MSSLLEKSKSLKKASYDLSLANTIDKNNALQKVAESLNENKDLIISENKKDIIIAKKNGMKDSLIDRLLLNEYRIDNMIKGIQEIISLKDPIWKSDEVWTIENGLTISKMTVPLGVVGIIYESRPNVTVDAFSLSIKSGNCILLRGSSSSINSNIALVYAIKQGLKNSNISENIIELIDDTDRALVDEMLKLNEYLDLIIPRGGKKLIDFVVKNSIVPTIETGVGNCHIYVDESADQNKALDIIENAKVQRPGVCNACETVLIHKNIKNEFLLNLRERLENRVELRGCKHTLEAIDIKEAKENDYIEEYLDYILAIKVVNDVNEAINHINKYGTKHSEAIITESLRNSNLFQKRIDAAAVYVNASTRFTDGSQFGFGAEMGISTQKIHARGPVGLNQLVSNKYTIVGDGQIRK
ncbi:glutamate-5-semialdehyde dehydrogenase [Senegalia massiliensis]|uniref:glutamate-5-semialdehyde dehydrogenase n=1 Tax=Senegalia massiliensis TaxID=1720316 RepID=UPI001032595D|nr:glutamate-5-semialdehyde dehydrogenase [Senegalia massiliensis]